jgi:CRISPR/Cas system-associated exonuclease Cas4 (RecB family)
MPPSAAPASRLVQALARVGRQHPFDAKLVVASSFGVGRELLRRLARRGEGWVGFEVTTPRALALRVVGPRLAAEGLTPIDGFARQALLDEALDGALRSAPDASLGELSEGVGFREAVHGAVLTLRAADLSPTEVRARRFRSLSRKRFLARVLERYEGVLRERHAADGATIYRLATEELGQGAESGRLLGAAVLLLLPGIGLRGLAGRFVKALVDIGAQPLPTDPTVGLQASDGILWAEAEPSTPLAYLHAPDRAPGMGAGIEMFHAASITDELREALRRVVEAGRRWDEVELITPSPSAYGSALHALASRLSIPVTYGAGLPLERTRTGRVVHAYLDWIGGGFQADPIRRLLEAGDLRPPRGAGFHAPAALARRFRSLRIGWGRRRYRTEVRKALAALDGQTPGPWEPPEAFDRRLRGARAELEALRSILFPALKATPSVPDRMGEGGGPIAPAELAHGLKAFLKRVPPGRGPDAIAKEEVLRTLDRVEAMLRRRTGFEAALAILRRHLDLRVRAARPRADDDPGDGGAPWLSEGGHLHLADLEHGGYTGRPVTFVLGLDADHVPGAAGQDPVLADEDRRSLGADVPTSGDLNRDRAHALAALLARLRGEVTFSYGAWDATAARSVGPSPLLLQAFRVRARSDLPTFQNLRAHLDGVACPIPRSGAQPLDPDDVWMSLLADEGVLRHGVECVRAAFPALDRGLRAARERREGIPGPFHGLVGPRPDLFDPRLNDQVVLSASRLEGLGACPLRYLHGTVLRLRPPDDPELDPDRWLDPLQRGTLLHAVYERSLSSARRRGIAETEPPFEELALEHLEDLVAEATVEIPSPGDGVRLRERNALREDVRSFVRMIREHGAHWSRLEMRFGVGEADAIRLPVPGGSLGLRGAIDRIDEDFEGVHVIDYKTGAPRDYDEGTGVYNGGRRLQHAIYAEAAERIMKRDVATGAFHFPTRRGQNLVITFPRESFQGLSELLGRMLDAIREGAFLPTDNAGDCRYCDFAAICRASPGDWGRVDSPMAEWSGDMMALGLHPPIRHLKGVRHFEST